MIRKRRSWHNQQSAPRNVFKPVLEVLEDRVIPSVDITYGGGPTIPHVQVTDIVMGTPVIPDTTPMMQAILKDYLPLLGPDYGIGSGTFQGSISTPAFSSNPTDAQVQSLIISKINSGSVPQPSSSQLYVVYLSTGQTVTDPDIGEAWGYHGVFYNGLQPIYYAVVYGVNVGPGDTSMIASHEVAEAVTDPEPSTGWADRNILQDDPNGGEGEVADIYATTVLPFSMDGYYFSELSGPQGQYIPPLPPPHPPPPPLGPPQPIGGGTSSAGGNSPTFIQAAITLYIDGVERIFQGDSAALEQSIQTNLPYAVFAGMDLGEFFLLTGELAAYNALQGNNNGGHS